jgi:hypothetical protein
VSTVKDSSIKNVNAIRQWIDIIRMLGRFMMY